MKRAGCAVALFLVWMAAAPPAWAQERIVLVPDRVIVGDGEILTSVQVVVRGERIEAIEPIRAADGADRYRLAGTLLPGLIDTHVHIGWYFDRNGRTATAESGDSEAQQLLYAMENAWQTLRGGVTTVQSLGAPIDRDLREALGRGVLPGPRILTSLRPVTAGTGDPAAIRAFVAEQAEAGADVIKIFASASIRVGGTPTLSVEQLEAACSEAAKRGLRSAVHAHGPESARRAVVAGCSSIEHGALLDRATLELIAERDVCYDPNVDLVLRNYAENKEHFLGVGNYTEEGFAQMAAAQPKALAVFREALTVPGLRMVFGTDAVAGAHGRNVEELIFRIAVGEQNPHAAVRSATFEAARCLGLEDRVGRVAVGLDADLMAVEGDPLEDPLALGRVRFVMSRGRVVRSDPWP